MKQLAKRLFDRLGLGRPAARSADPFAGFPDLAESDRDIVRRVQPFTMTSVERLAALTAAIAHIVRHDIPGDIVECGVWRGGSSMAAAHALLNRGDRRRRLWLFDTFQGMTPPSAHDRTFDGDLAETLLKRDADGSGYWCYASFADVRRNLASTGYPADQINYVQGKVEETIPAMLPEKIALLRLDTDWYESTRHELRHLYPRLSRHGVLIIDDYGHWEGARKAVDEFVATLPYPLFLHRIDYTARIAIKPL